MNFVHLVARRVSAGSTINDSAGGGEFTLLEVDVDGVETPIPVVVPATVSEVDRGWPEGEMRAVAGELTMMRYSDGGAGLAVVVSETAGLNI